MYYNTLPGVENFFVTGTSFRCRRKSNMNLKRTLIKGTKRFFCSSVSGLSISLVVTGCFANPTAAQVGSGNKPSVATVKSMVNGDRMCYVTLADANGVQYKNAGATFDVCAGPNPFVNKTVNLVYGEVPVSDCQSVEACNKTRLQTLITQMTVVDDSRTCSRSASAGYTIPRLQVGMTGRSVTRVNLRVRQQPGIESQTVGSLTPGSNFRVLEGPACVGNYVWWKVNAGRVQGWVAEADPATSTYWLELAIARHPSGTPRIELIGQGGTASYRLIIDRPENIIFVTCPANYTPKLGYLRNIEAIQCERFGDALQDNND